MDTDNPTDFASTLGGAVHSALIQGAGAINTLRAARAAFELGDEAKARLIVMNATAPIDDKYVSIQTAIANALPRKGEPVSGYG